MTFLTHNITRSHKITDSHTNPGSSNITLITKTTGRTITESHNIKVSNKTSGVENVIESTNKKEITLSGIIIIPPKKNTISLESHYHRKSQYQRETQFNW